VKKTPEIQSYKKTVLLVDDEPDTLVALSVFLSVKYNILTANSGPEALQKSKEFKDEIHLLLADFDMTGMSGVALATAITLQRPAIQVLLMSPFTEGMLVLNEGWHFLARPFIPSQLSTLIGGLVSPPGKSKF
jgi:response regulator RpfG family c-di-GMP phosphodiesterase